MPRRSRNKNYTIRGTRGARGKSLYQQDLHAEAVEGERVQRELYADFYERRAARVHPRDRVAS